MDSIKFNISENKSYPIEKVLFEEKTRKTSPFYQEIEKGELSQFAICPECNNPVQIIGLYKKLQRIEAPYAKHCGKPIQGIGYYNQENYEYCPYRAKRKTYTKDSRKGGLDEVAQNIIYRMVNYFDKIIYLLQNKIGIFISYDLAEKMLRNFFASRAYLYNGATQRNMPLILAYFSLNTRIVGRRILSEELAECIRKTENLYIDGNNQIKSKNYSNAGFYFLKHKTHLKENHLSESIILKITQGTFDNPEHIYEKEIIFDNNHVENLLNYTPREESISEYHKKKNATLLEIAKKVASEHGFNVT